MRVKEKLMLCILHRFLFFRRKEKKLPLSLLSLNFDVSFLIMDYTYDYDCLSSISNCESKFTWNRLPLLRHSDISTALFRLEVEGNAQYRIIENNSIE